MPRKSINARQATNRRRDIMSEATYSGWTNYETWLVNQYISNDEGMYEQALEIAREFVAWEEGSKGFQTEDSEIHVIARGRALGKALDALKEMIQEAVGLFEDTNEDGYNDADLLKRAGVLSGVWGLQNDMIIHFIEKVDMRSTLDHLCVGPREEWDNAREEARVNA